jgi:hypothetical protein
MFKELRFDVVGAVRRTEKYDGEWEAIHQFNASEHKNMVFDYDSEREAKSAYSFLTNLVKKENIPIKFQLYRKTSLLVTRIDGGEKNV